MYAIGQIIFGIPLVSDDARQIKINFDELSDTVFDDFEEHEDDDCGYMEYYHGGSDEEPRAFGVHLGSFDECCAFIDVDTLKLTATDEDREKYQELVASMAPETQEYIKQFGEPRVFILWTTS